MDKKFLQQIKVVSKRGLLTSVVGSAFLFSGNVQAINLLSSPGQTVAAQGAANIAQPTFILGNTTMNNAALTFNTANTVLAIGPVGTLQTDANNAIPIIVNDNLADMALINLGTFSNTGTLINLTAAGNNAMTFTFDNVGDATGNLAAANGGNALTLIVNMGDGSSTATPTFTGNINLAGSLAAGSQLNVKNNFTTGGTIDGAFDLIVGDANATATPTLTISNVLGGGNALDFITVEAGATVNAGANVTANTAASTVRGILNVNSGTTTLGATSANNVNAEINVASGATLAAGAISFGANAGTVNVNGTMTSTGALDLTNGGVFNLNSGGAYTAGAATDIDNGQFVLNGGTFNTGGNAVADNAANAGVIKLKATSTINGGGGLNLQNNANTVLVPNIGATEPTLNMTNAAASNFNGLLTRVIVDGYVPNGKVYTVVSSSAALNNALGAVTLDATSVDKDVSFAAGGAVGTQTMTLTATRTKTLSDKAGVPELKDLSDGLDKSAKNNSDVRAILSEVIKLKGDDLREGFEQFVPDKAGGAHVGALVGNDGITNAGFLHLAELRDGTSYAAGQPGSHLAGWAKLFGVAAEQKRRKGVEGYDADTFGLSVGLDKELSKNFLLGLGLGYANTEVESRMKSASKVDVKSWQGTFYGSYMSGNMFVDGALSYSGNKFDRERHVKAGAIDQIYKADHNGHQVAAKLLAGYKMGSNVNVTPKFGLSYVKSKQDSYTEKTDVRQNSALNVSDSTVDMFKGKFGVEFSKSMRMKDGGVSMPKLELSVLHDFTGDENVATYNFVNSGAPSFKVTGPTPARTSFMVSLGWKYSNAHKEFGLNYDFETKDKYVSHAGMAVFRYKW